MRVSCCDTSLLWLTPESTHQSFFAPVDLWPHKNPNQGCYTDHSQTTRTNTQIHTYTTRSVRKSVHALSVTSNIWWTKQWKRQLDLGIRNTKIWVGDRNMTVVQNTTKYLRPTGIFLCWHVFNPVAVPNFFFFSLCNCFYYTYSISVEIGLDWKSNGVPGKGHWWSWWDHHVCEISQ